ncbi:hypothetical protein ACFQY4_23325 [Catellatospora bangladeshensis]|uniref:hypothetical protein n=1 Tax=Catellatospora bangladeshensis TaxID=310355 RepID=UPI003614F20C
MLLVGVGAYAHHDPISDMEVQLRRVAELFRELGGLSGSPWPPPAGPSMSAVNEELRRWSEPDPARCSVVVWLGHGESDGDDAWLGVYETGKPMRGTGLSPHAVADHVVNEWQRRAAHADAWAMVVVEACGADTFVRRLASHLLGRHTSPQRLALIGSGGEGTGYLGRFSDALEATLRSYTDNDESVSLKDLVGRLEDRLEEGCAHLLSARRAARLVRRRVLPGPVNAPLDLYEEFRRFLLGLSADERTHFLPKAQGGELGELAWHFVGRAEESRRIVDWLRGSGRGLYVVTGPPGVGKSALLGNVLVESDPGMRDLLARATDYVPVYAAPARAFHAVMSLTGLRVSDVVERLAWASGVGSVDGVDGLVAALHARGMPFRVLADALDEAQEPQALASGVWRRLVGVPGCRVVLGMRPATGTDPDVAGRPARICSRCCGGPTRRCRRWVMTQRRWVRTCGGGWSWRG